MRPLNNPSIQALNKLLEACLSNDGIPPFSDQSLTRVFKSQNGDSAAFTLWSEGDIEVLGASVYSPETRLLEFAIHPRYRGQGLGQRLFSKLKNKLENFSVWAHGSLPPALAIARKNCGRIEREILKLRLDLVGELQTTRLEGLRLFDPAKDSAAWLRLNRLIFAKDPDQGRINAQDLTALMEQPWFSQKDFWLYAPECKLRGFVWLKTEPKNSVGEVYVLGIHPELQGRGLGRRLLSLALASLQKRNFKQAELYVQSENLPAYKLYEALGFKVSHRDIQFSFTATPDFRR